MQALIESGTLTMRPLRARDVHTYHICDISTELLLYFMVVFGPWAFGTTEPWSIWTMNASSYLLGLLLACKLVIRFSTKYAPRRWDDDEIGAGPIACELNASRDWQWLYRVTKAFLSWGSRSLLVICTWAIIGYSLVAAINARATYRVASTSFEFHNCISWLPSSLDSRSTWQSFWTFLALGCSFWAIFDWLQGKTSIEKGADLFQAPRANAAQFPARFRRLMWVLTVSGGLLGMEGIAQRLLNSPRLLFLVRPEIHQEALEQFASYAYRGNGAQYFNLLWPGCLAFWWTLHRSSGASPAAKRLVLAGVVTMTACPMLSNARCSAMVGCAMLLVATLVLFASIFQTGCSGSRKRRCVSALATFLACTLALGSAFGWRTLRSRLDSVTSDIHERNQLYERGEAIARDYPLFGTGPGTFETVFQLYRISPDDYWPAQLHNDWLETRVTFGWIGFGLISLALLTLLVNWSAAGGPRKGGVMALLLWLALGGCLFQARWDFPLQIHSIVFLFLVWCAVLLSALECKVSAVVGAGLQRSYKHS
jgi:hypothetical protein